MMWDDFLASRKKRLELQHRVDQLEKQVAQEQKKRDLTQQACFLRNFREKMEQVIMPAFGKCVQSLNRYGIKAQEVNRMNRAHPNVSLDIRYDRQNYCMFLLAPLESDGKVAMRTLIHKNNEWNYEDATQIDVDQLSESLIREKVQEAIDVLDER